ncbi:alpha/beta hydrolase [Variovorax rhizosphaerae]|uniref:Alpha/beta hydrolase n=1 Tax=Variovorax rhizosphaerae TaxID=1836200 RepID=A0ABU8WUC2_9BURK
MSIVKRTAASAAILLSLASAAPEAGARSVAEGANTVGAVKVSFKNRAITMVGHLYTPPNYDRNRKYPAVVVTHPWGGVKEQTAGLYAQKLAEKGFVTLAFDASHYGESGGEPRDLENPADRVQDIRSAIGYLSNLPQVDPKRIGALGICAGGGYTLDEVQTDLRVKAVAGVVSYDIGAATREGIEGVPVSAQDRLDLLASVDRQLNKEAGGEPVLVEQLIPGRDKWTDATPGFFREAYDYYLTPRGAHPGARNRYVVTSPGLHMAYFPFSQMDAISPRPLLLIAGSKAETLKFSQDAFDNAKQPKELMVIPGASHFDLYDKPQYVTPAVAKLAEFFGRNL